MKQHIDGAENKIIEVWKILTTESKREIVNRVAQKFELQPYYVRDSYFIRKKIPASRISQIHNEIEKVLTKQNQN